MRLVSFAIAAALAAALLAPAPVPAQSVGIPPGRLILSSSTDGVTAAAAAVRSDGSTVVPVVVEDRELLWPRPSPDGRQIVFQSRDEQGDWELYVVDSRGGDPVQITDNDHADGFPSWGPDGTIISASDPDDSNNPEIVLHDPSTGTSVRLTNHSAVDSHPALSPDGARIAFMSDRDGEPDVWVMDLDGGGLLNLTPGAGGGHHPAWSPDGSRIAFTDTRDGDFDVYVMAADGRDVVQLTDVDGTDGAPSWSPDGTWLAFSTARYGGGDRDIVAGPADDLSDPVPMALTDADEFSVGWGPLPPVEVIRLEGPTRIHTAIAIAEDAWDPPVRAAVLARSDAFPDALAGGPLAARLLGPLLLTGRDGLHPDTAATLTRLLGPVAGQQPVVYLLGGTAALSDAVQADVEALGLQTVRLSGPTRFDTAVAIARQSDAPGPVFIADGGDFRPALVAGAAAADAGGVLVLTSGSDVPAATTDYLAERGSGTRQVAVGSAAVAALPDREAIDGDTPYSVGVAAAVWAHGHHPANLAFASGENFPDGLAGGAHARWFSAPLLLTGADALPDEVAEHLGDMHMARRVYVYGGPVAVSDGVVARILAVLEGR